MAIPLQLILEQRAVCPVHLQAEVLDIRPPESWRGPVTMRARVVRVFRGAVTLGDTIAIRVNAVRTGDRFPSGDFFYAWDNLRAALHRGLPRAKRRGAAITLQ